MRQLFQGMVTVIAVSSAALAGCAGPDPATGPDTATFHAPPNSVVLGEFVAHNSPKNHTFTIERVGDGAAYGPTLQPESLSSLTIINDGNPNGNPANTVQLDTVSTSDPYPSQQTFSADVIASHYFARSFANFFVQVTAITDSNNMPLTGHDAINSYSGDSYGLDPTHGLWLYTADTNCGQIGESGCNAANAPGVLAQSPNNGGLQTWTFANPDDADDNIQLAVYASSTWPDYTFSFGNLGYMDACTGGSSTTNAKQTVTIPFDFTLYSSNSTTVNFARNGQITIGSTAVTASTNPVNLPSTSAPHPVIFPFWDNLVFGAGGKMCWQTIGTAPNRQLRNMNFGNAPGNNPPSSLDFEVYLYEGTGEIDTVYNTMNGDATSNGRENGAKAYVGIQDNTGTVATGEFQTQDYGTGNSYSYVPNAL
jgi:hypothetical protein